MPKPVCVKCQCFYRPKRNATAWIEMMPKVNRRNEQIRGTREPDAWQPYKLWQSDLWECPDCGHQLISGHGHEPIRIQHHPDFNSMVKRFGAEIQINDC